MDEPWEPVSVLEPNVPDDAETTEELEDAEDTMNQGPQRSGCVTTKIVEEIEGDEEDEDDADAAGGSKKSGKRAATNSSTKERAAKKARLDAEVPKIPELVGRKVGFVSGEIDEDCCQMPNE